LHKYRFLGFSLSDINTIRSIFQRFKRTFIHFSLSFQGFSSHLSDIFVILQVGKNLLWEE
jgi:hypothetical protein